MMANAVEVKIGTTAIHKNADGDSRSQNKEDDERNHGWRHGATSVDGLAPWQKRVRRRITVRERTLA